MVQELIDLKKSIVEGRYQDALTIVDELEGMSKQAIIRNIESFLVIMLVHLIKNQVEQRLTNSWAASITNSIRQIKKLNLKDNKKSYYINQDQWFTFLEEALEAAIFEASIEVSGGIYNPIQLRELVDYQSINNLAYKLLDLTYSYSAKDLLLIVQQKLTELPGGKEWSEKIK